MDTKKLGRPTTWPTQIQAPTLALEFYELLARISPSDAFDGCHIYTGPSRSHKVPIISFKGKLKPLASVAASALGLPTSQKTCGTKDCVNPFHHLPAVTTTFVTANTRDTAPQEFKGPNIAELWELIEYTADENALPLAKLTFTTLRPLIHPDDMSDFNLKLALEANNPG